MKIILKLYLYIIFSFYSKNSGAEDISNKKVDKFTNSSEFQKSIKELSNIFDEKEGSEKKEKYSFNDVLNNGRKKYSLIDFLFNFTVFYEKARIYFLEESLSLKTRENDFDLFINLFSENFIKMDYAKCYFFSNIVESSNEGEIIFKFEERKVLVEKMKPIYLELKKIKEINKKYKELSKNLSFVKTTDKLDIFEKQFEEFVLFFSEAIVSNAFFYLVSTFFLKGCFLKNKLENKKIKEEEDMLKNFKKNLDIFMKIDSEEKNLEDILFVLSCFCKNKEKVCFFFEVYSNFFLNLILKEKEGIFIKEEEEGIREKIVYINNNVKDFLKFFKDFVCSDFEKYTSFDKDLSSYNKEGLQYEVNKLSTYFYNFHSKVNEK